MNVYDTLLATPRAETFAERVRAEFSEESYGKTWCLTDVLRLDRRSRAQLLDVIVGIVAGKSRPEERSTVRIALRSVSGGPITFPRHWPEGPAPAGMTDEHGVAHHHPRQWKTRTVTLPASISVPVASDVPQESAVWLLNKMGWKARQGGSERWRYMERRPSKRSEETITVDQWTVVEEAFETMHPGEAPSPAADIEKRPKRVAA